ncbi:hypothetical protein LAZ67_10001664 [Cordylochernes scorpioides]|uniref:Secreted protein n=1 Tax=Cordylochernes scorpioides TaxID=51811 RepID=A0ABY6KW21_9ARAC|nr:hypothetical protein LAZ67_10001664 [Cordylochernes scorpioides]
MLLKVCQAIGEAIFLSVPIALGFSMLQGQTLQVVGVHLESPCFSHGTVKEFLELARRIDQHLVYFEQRRSCRQKVNPIQPFPLQENIIITTIEVQHDLKPDTPNIERAPN